MNDEELIGTINDIYFYYTDNNDLLYKNYACENISINSLIYFIGNFAYYLKKNDDEKFRKLLYEIEYRTKED
jgi:hypothetical protein